ncbi:rRNA-processing protein UTP23 homolog [Lytechinus variegatus]|uniref:rRNA-processing protein UTP23 homolog n=1 Tax=Lytechinus variegatus TaxID=7654 RepID=UPI001BB161D5|nr:rRNA-processing protein UTP23 homolog [Lytechinus variegatus]XP_041483794.1 rRNA-processing protein UTP23 homolog [Lytechinus variegatus]XP_041483795.1 rRNA-processing protein UTP23 homolog [Lytechinus variegatus]
MKVKRYKHARKYLGFYKHNFNFREPHQVLVDGTFTRMALQNKINIKEQLPKYLGGEVQLTTTNCILKEAEALGKAVYGAYVILKRFQVRRCGHKDKAVSAFKCVMSMIADSNKNHYFIATQDPDLSSLVHRTPGTPLLYLHFSAIVLEKPSVTSTAAASSMTSKKINPSEFEKSALKKLQGADGTDEGKKKRKKRRGPKQPNPLSVKKKKKKSTEQGSVVTGETEGKKKRRRRKKVKIASHVQEQLQVQQAFGS